MIRRDYILRMIEEFIRALARIRSLKQDEKWNAAEDVLDEEFQRLIGQGAREIASLSETELIARLVQEGPAQAVREKIFIVATLLQEAGDAAVAQNRNDEGRAFHLKALHLLLHALAYGGDPAEFPEFVPKVEAVVQALNEEPLPVGTQAMLMEHYERTGEFAKAEDALFAILDAEPGNPRIREHGISFYRRLSSRSDAQLTEGNLSREEVEEGLKELQRISEQTL